MPLSVRGYRCSLGGALTAIEHARVHDVALLGTCGGFQHVVLEFARNVVGLEDAQHAEYDPYASTLFITPLSCSLAGQIMTVHVKKTRRMSVCPRRRWLGNAHNVRHATSRAVMLAGSSESNGDIGHGGRHSRSEPGRSASSRNSNLVSAAVAASRSGVLSAAYRAGATPLLAAT